MFAKYSVAVFTAPKFGRKLRSACPAAVIIHICFDTENSTALIRAAVSTSFAEDVGALLRPIRSESIVKDAEFARSPVGTEKEPLGTVFTCVTHVYLLSEENSSSASAVGSYSSASAVG